MISRVCRLLDGGLPQAQQLHDQAPSIFPSDWRRGRGVNNILIAVVDGLKGFPGPITPVFPHTLVQTCIVHLLSLAFISWKDRKAILPSIKAIYRVETADIALVRREEFEAEWGKRYPAIGQAWRRAWEHVVPFLRSRPVSAR